MCESCTCTCGNKPWLWIDCGYHQAVKADHPAVLREEKRRSNKAMDRIVIEANQRARLGWPLTPIQAQLVAERETEPSTGRGGACLS